MCGPRTLNIRKSCTLFTECMYVCMYVCDSCDSYSERRSIPQGRINRFIHVIEKFCASCEVETIFNNIIYTRTKSVRVGMVRGSNSGGGEISAPVQPGHGGPPSLLHNCYHLCFPGVNRPRRDFHHPPQCCAEIKEELELYRSSLCGRSLPVLGRPLPLPLHPE